MSRELELLTEIRDLLRVIAEPALANRDAELRSSLRSIVGGSAQRARAVLLMDGTRPQSVIAKESGVDKGNLSRLLKALVAARLVCADEKQPRLLIDVSSEVFEGDDAGE